MYVCMFDGMGRFGCLLVKVIELPTRFARRFLQGSMLCTIVFMRLFIRILCDVMYRVERQILKFSKFVDDSSLFNKVSLERDELWRSKIRSLRSVNII